MDKPELVKNVFDTVGAIAKTSDFIAAGLKEHTVFSLCKQGYIERVKYGHYKFPDLNEPQEEYLLSKLLTKGMAIINDTFTKSWSANDNR